MRLPHTAEACGQMLSWYQNVLHLRRVRNGARDHDQMNLWKCIRLERHIIIQLAGFAISRDLPWKWQWCWQIFAHHSFCFTNITERNISGTIQRK